MAHQYTDAEAQQIFSRGMSEVWGYYRDLAERQRPAIERAAARLQGHAAPEPAPDPVVDDAEEETEPDLGEEGEPGEDAAVDGAG